MELSPGSVSAYRQREGGRGAGSGRGSALGSWMGFEVRRVLRHAARHAGCKTHTPSRPIGMQAVAVSCSACMRMPAVRVAVQADTHPCPAGWAPGWRHGPGRAGAAPPHSQCPALQPPGRLQQWIGRRTRAALGVRKHEASRWDRHSKLGAPGPHSLQPSMIQRVDRPRGHTQPHPRRSAGRGPT